MTNGYENYLLLKSQMNSDVDFIEQAFWKREVTLAYEIDEFSFKCIDWLHLFEKFI